MTTPAAPDSMSAALLTRPRSTWQTLPPDSACESRECPTPTKGLDKTAKPMAPVPETRYTNADGVSVAYSVVGDGPPDLVFVPDWLTNLELLWGSPMSARHHERLASFSRLIVFDKRGTGLSDPVALTELPTLEQWMDDVRAVSDAAGSERPALMGVGGAGAMCMLYAATYPERVSALVLIQTCARVRQADDYPAGIAPEIADAFVSLVARHWGTRAMVEVMAPSAAGDLH